MLDTKTSVDTVLQYTVTCEVSKTQVNELKVRQRLGDALLFMDGIGVVDVAFLGELLPAESANE